ncbi:uncharacterized protein LOC111008895 [Momordica charantia]|uniref:Uncharacterized protein LOC111008895 n=1 Tax=Momordica charantia TaxID=3673 RepID=A0A6J1C6P8_MOMCH|nr:uncharacterized protein LOC111008895 [Momordica charantia]
MGHATPERGGSGSGSGSVLASPKRAAATLLISLSTLVALCAKEANRVSKKLQTKLKSKQFPRLELRSPQVRPKRFLKSISDTAITLMQKNKNKKTKRGGCDAEDEWGDGGIWQKAILMGDKCEPLNFSGVIYYDSKGKQLNEVPPRSPRASPLPSYLATGHRQVY